MIPSLLNRLRPPLAQICQWFSNHPPQPLQTLPLPAQTTKDDWFKKFRLGLVMLSLVLLWGCTTVYQDEFDATTLGEPPGPPAVGTSSVSGEVRIAENPINDVSSDLWLQLRRPSPLEPAIYEGTFAEPITAETGTVTLAGYIPGYAPSTLSLYFITTRPELELLHIDLLRDSNIRIDDRDIVGTYEFDTSVLFLVTFNLADTPPVATILVRGGGQDASTTVDLPPSLANFGLNGIRIEAPFEGVNSPPGLFLINDVLASRRTTSP